MNQLNKNRQAALLPTGQIGYSLIELMIASTLGLFILGGVMTSFLGTKDSEKMRSAVSEMDASARTAIEMLRRNISLAGYSSMRNIQDFNKPFYSAIDETDTHTKGTTDRSCGGGINMYDGGDAPTTSQYTVDSGGADPNDGRGDVITTVYLADNPCTSGSANCPTTNINPDAMVYTDCTGGGALRNALTVSCSTDETAGMPNFSVHAKIYSTYYLGGGANDRTLYCRGSRGGTQPMVENVEYLQFLYGVTRANGTTEYLRANTVETNNEWSYVTSVRVGLLMRSDSDSVLKKASTKTNYILLDRNVSVSDMHRLYRAYTTTINLPNRNRGLVL